MRSLWCCHPVAFIEHLKKLVNRPELIWAKKIIEIHGKEKGEQILCKVADICKEMGFDPNYLMACMAFETGEEFSSSTLNAAGSGAVGLIQFMPSTATDLKTTTDYLKNLDEVSQLDWVKKYFKRQMGSRKITTLTDVYMAILYPSLIGKSDNAVFADRNAEGNSKAARLSRLRYTQNRGLDKNNNGIITKVEISGKILSKFEKGKKFIG